MKPKTSRDLPAEPPHRDKERENRAAIAKDADKTNDADRDLVHGDGSEKAFRQNLPVSIAAIDASANNDSEF